MASSSIWLPSGSRTTTQTSPDISTAGFKKPDGDAGHDGGGHGIGDAHDQRKGPGERQGTGCYWLGPRSSPT